MFVRQVRARLKTWLDLRRLDYFGDKKVVPNELKNASFAQRSAHREGKKMATGINRTGRRA